VTDARQSQSPAAAARVSARCPLRIGALISGGGRTLMNLADQIDSGSFADDGIDASIDLVIASRADCAGIERAGARGMDVIVIARRDHPNEAAMHDAVTDAIVRHRIDLVCLCGYLRKMRVDPPLAGKIINIHPALLPDFGGQGMYGERVHRAVLAAGRAVSGCTVHYVDEHYDHGPTIVQRECPVLPGDDERTLAARVFEQECIAYPEAIKKFVRDRAAAH